MHYVIKISPDSVNANPKEKENPQVYRGLLFVLD